MTSLSHPVPQLPGTKLIPEPFFTLKIIPFANHLLQIEIQRLTCSDPKNCQHGGVDSEEQGSDDEQHAEEVQVQAVHDEAGGVGPQQ